MSMYYKLEAVAAIVDSYLNFAHFITINYSLKKFNPKAAFNQKFD